MSEEIPVVEGRQVNRNKGGRPRKHPVRTAAPRSAADAGSAGSPDPHAAAPLVEADDRRTDDSHEITRRSRSERTLNQFDIPANWRKPGWDYQFWVTSVVGQPVENSQFMDVYEGGWRPVYWKDVPKPWNPGAKAEDQIERLGQRLFLRPMKLTQQARQEDYQAAEQQRLDRIRSAAEGRVSGGEGVADIRGVRPVSLGVSVEGEVGTQTRRTPTQ